MENFQRQNIPRHALTDAVLAKWPEDVLAEGYVPFPKKLLRNLTRLFDGAHAMEDLAVILALVDYRRRNLSRDPSVQYVSFMSGLTRKEVDDTLKRLKKRKWVTVGRPAEDGGIAVGLTGFTTAIQEVAGTKP
jgi:hypothetical protein